MCKSKLGNGEQGLSSLGYRQLILEGCDLEKIHPRCTPANFVLCCAIDHQTIQITTYTIISSRPAVPRSEFLLIVLDLYWVTSRFHPETHPLFADSRH